MSGIWSFLEIVGGTGAVVKTWKKRLAGDEFEPFRQVALRRLPNPATQYPCPRGCGCVHRVVRYPDNEGIEAVCQCEPWRCDNVPVMENDLVLYAPDLNAMGRAAVRAFGFHQREKEMGIHGMLQIGAFTDRAIPVILAVQPNRMSFRARVCEVAAKGRREFILIAPTANFMDSTTGDILTSLGGMFISLAATVRVTPSGQLQTIKPPLEILDAIVPSRESTDVELVATALGLIQMLDEKSVERKPTHAEFFHLYCVEGLSLGQIMKKTGCSRGTASHRKQRCEATLKTSLSRFHQHSSIIETLEKQRREVNARYINSRAAIYDDAGFDERD